ncbi:MAG: PepSY domain-containing protein [Lachnospiraceae bacterium]|nr:PepSY domain-containing protein [Lachnospiraceae bacterium]
MDGYDVKKAMDQVHISSEMQEEIIIHIQKKMENGNKNMKTWNWRRIATAAAVFVLVTGIVSFPVRAYVTSIVRDRMERIPKEEVQEINSMVQSKPTEADEFSREYSDSEKERNKALWQAYKGGQFPENVIAQVDNAEDAPEGTLCYIRSTGVFNLPPQEMTDEEILEIIDFQHMMSYAVSQGTAAQEAIAEKQAKEDQWRERIQAAGGISEEDAIEIATRQMQADLGERAEGKEILRYQDGSEAVLKIDLSDQTSYEHKGDMAYLVHFSNPGDHSLYYECTIDAVDGSILNIRTNETIPEE